MKLIKVYRQPSMKLMFLISKDTVDPDYRARAKERESIALDEQVRQIIRKRLTRFTSKKK